MELDIGVVTVLFFASVVVNFATPATAASLANRTVKDLETYSKRCHRYNVMALQDDDPVNDTCRVPFRVITKDHGVAYTSDAEGNCKLLKKIVCHELRVIQFYVDVIDPQANINYTANGYCPPGHSSKGNLHLPHIFQVIQGKYGLAFLSMPVSNLDLYSATTFDRHLADYHTPHVKMIADDSCWKNLSYYRRSIKMLASLYEFYIKHQPAKPDDPCHNILYKSLGDRFGLRNKTMCELTSAWTEDERKKNQLCFAHPLKLISKGTLMLSFHDDTRVYHCCEMKPDGDIICEDLCDTPFMVMIRLLANFFFLVVVFFFSPLVPLRIMSAMVDDVIQPLSAKICQSIVCPTDTYVTVKTTDLRHFSRQHSQTDTHPYLLMEGSFWMNASVPACFTAVRVWPSLQLLYSSTLHQLAVVLAYICLFIIWPFIATNEIAVVGKEINREEARPSDCKNSIKTTNIFLATSTFFLLFPMIYLLFHIRRVKRHKPRQYFLPPPNLKEGLRQERQWQDLKALVDGKLQPNPLTKCIQALGALVTDFFNAFRSDLQRNFRLALTKVTGRIRQYACCSRSTIMVNVLVSLLLIPICVGLVLLTLAKAIARLLRGLIDLAVLLMEIVPLLRLANAMTFSIWGPLFGLDASSLVLVCSAFVSIGIFFTHYIACQMIIIYVSMTILGLLVNYLREVILYVSILSAIVIEAHNGYMKLYRPLLDLKSKVVCVAFDCYQEHLKATLRSQVDQQQSSWQNKGRSEETQEASLYGEEEEMLLRKAAGLTYLDMAYITVADGNDEVNRAFEKNPFAHCNSGPAENRDNNGSYEDVAMPLLLRSALLSPQDDICVSEFQLRQTQESHALLREIMHAYRQADDQINVEVSTSEKEDAIKTYMREQVAVTFKKGALISLFLILLFCIIWAFDMILWDGHGHVVRVVPLLIPIIEFLRIVCKAPQAKCGVSRMNVFISKLFIKHVRDVRYPITLTNSSS